MNRYVYLVHVPLEDVGDIIEAYDNEEAAKKAREEIEQDHLRDDQTVDLKQRKLHSQ